MGLLQLRKRVRFDGERPEELAKQVGELARDALRVSDAALARDGSTGPLLATLDADDHDFDNVGVITHGAAPLEAKANASALLILDWRDAQFQQVELTANVTQVQLIAPSGIGMLRVVVRQDATGGRTVAGWDSEVLWPGGTAPTISAGASAIDLLEFFWDGTNYLGSFRQAFA